MDDLKDLITKLQNENYSKEPLKEKQEKVLKLFDDLYDELNELIKGKIVNIEINLSEYDVTILIVSSKALLISEFNVILNELLFLADMKNMEIIEGKIALKLWFRCWEYCKT